MTPYTTLSEKGPIGVFDSGMGGLTVMRRIRAHLPDEPLVYFGDTSRVPYGNKIPETIVRYSLEAASFFKSQGVKALVVACNTASSYALTALEYALKVPVLGVIAPGAEAAINATKTGRIGVLGTKATVASGAYQTEILGRMPDAHLFPIACPLFVPLVEERLIRHPATRLMIKEYLEPLKKQEIDTLLLGCTHYPVLAELLQEEIGYKVQIIDSGLTTAKSLDALLDAHDLKSQKPKAPEFYVSDDPDKFRLMGELFLGERIPECFLVTEELAPI